MSSTRWAVQGPDGATVEINGRKFSANDSGAPMMCNTVCLSLGRHIHIDYCRSNSGDGVPNCENADVEHLPTAMLPEPDRAKDAITHSLFWRRNGKFHFTKSSEISLNPSVRIQRKGAIYLDDCMFRLIFNTLSRSLPARRPGGVCQMVRGDRR